MVVGSTARSRGVPQRGDTLRYDRPMTDTEHRITIEFCSV
jgi:hypothetical protein